MHSALENGSWRTTHSSDKASQGRGQEGESAMLRVHFLNVGHGDCTIIEHPSGRLTMIDINNSQTYDRESYREFMAERRQRELASALEALSGESNWWALRPLGVPADVPAPLLGDLLAAPAYPVRPLGIGSAFGWAPFWGRMPTQMDPEEAARELTDPIAYMHENFPGRRLFRFILTHPDLDHMRGLSRLFGEIGFDNFWDITHDKQITDFRSDADREDWNLYRWLRSGSAGVSVMMLHRGNMGYAWNRDYLGVGDGIEILSPTLALVAACWGTSEFNDASYILRMHHARRTVLLPGDAGDKAWDDLVHAYGAHLRSDVLKGAHHGRDSGYHLGAVRLIDPCSVVVSVGRKPETTDAHSKYHYHCGNVKSTRYKGNIVAEIRDDSSLHWYVDRNANI